MASPNIRAWHIFLLWCHFRVHLQMKKASTFAPHFHALLHTCRYKNARKQSAFGCSSLLGCFSCNCYAILLHAFYVQVSNAFTFHAFWLPLHALSHFCIFQLHLSYLSHLSNPWAEISTNGIAYTLPSADAPTPELPIFYFLNTNSRVNPKLEGVRTKTEPTQGMNLQF